MTATLLSSDPIQAAPSVCLHENPNRPVSLLDMLRFHAEHFCRCSSLLGQIFKEIQGGILPRSSSWSLVGNEVRLLKEHAKAMGLVATVAQIERVEQMAASDYAGANMGAFGQNLIEVKTRLNDELAAQMLFSLDSDKSQMYSDSGFPRAVVDRFPSVIFDMEEAGKCYALERPTACVYHLMRVTEFGLNQIGKSLGIKDERPNWAPIIKKIDAELKKDFKDREFKGMSDFLAHSSAHMNAVKIAWRNRVMHVDTKHTMEEARDIYNATVGLMRYISENLPRERPGIVRAIRGIINQ